MKKMVKESWKLRPFAIAMAALVLMMLVAACGDSGNADAISAVAADVSAQSAEIDALSAQVAELQAGLADAQKMESEEVAELRAAITAMSGQSMAPEPFDDSALRSDIGEVRALIAELQDRMDDDDQDDQRIDSEHLDSLDAQLMELGDNIVDLKAAISVDQDEFDEIAGQLWALRNDLTFLQEASTSDELEQALSRLDWLESSLGPAYTKAYVEQAIRRYSTEGRQATLDYYNTIESVSGDLYLFVLDENYELIVHPTVPSNIGMDIRGPLGTDITGKNYGAEFVTVDDEGKWVDYVYLNPADDFDYERKHSWIVRHDGLIFGSGWYEREVSLQSTPAAYARALVEQAVVRYDAIGKDATLSYYNHPASVDGQYYVFIIDSSDLRSIANGARPELVGNIPDRIDPTGYDYGKDIAAATEDGDWISYVFLNPDTVQQQRKHSWITLHDGLIFGSGWYEPVIATKDNPPAYTQALVEQAIARYERDGHDATIAYYNSPESIDGQWYVFIADENDVMIAHAAVPDNVGKSPDEIISPDGYPAGAQVAAAAVEGGAWTTYTYLNAATGNVETKHSWVTRHNGMVFGSGWYEEGPPKSDAAAYTKAFVDRAINLYNDLGHDGTIAYYNSPESMDGQWYVFIGDENDVMIAHAAVPDNVGLDFDDIISPADGYPAGAQVAAAAVEGGAWTTYTYLNASTGNVETKHSWVTRHNGMIFGSGWYEEGAPKSDAPAYAQSLVQRAVNLYDDLGQGRTVDYYNTPESVDGQFYVFILRADDLRTFANGARPELVDIDPPERIDANGYAYGEAFAETTDEGQWVSYVFINPETNELESKHSWVLEHEGFLFGSGWYADPAVYTQHLVDEAVSLYESQGHDATISYYNTAESVDGQWYVFIVDAGDFFLSHAPSPSLLGTDLKEVVGSDGFELGKEIAKATEEGHWVEYLWPNPATEMEETKRSWVIRHDGLIFGSGYYGEPSS